MAGAAAATEREALAEGAARWNAAHPDRPLELAHREEAGPVCPPEPDQRLALVALVTAGTTARRSPATP